MALKTDYKDDVPVSKRRKYQMVDNGDGTVSFVDVTEYLQEGDAFGAADINATNEAVNNQAQRPIDNNLLINSNFTNPVNQRGLTKYYDESNSVGWEGYTIDRWKSECTSVTINDGSITLGNCYPYGDTSWFRQYIDIPAECLAGKTIAVSFETDGGMFNFVDVLPSDLSSYYASEPHYIDSKSYVDIGRDSVRDLITITFHPATTITLKWAKVEIGNTATPYIPRTYAEEFSLCQYYYQKFHSANKESMFANTAVVNFMFNCPSKMRIKSATVTLDDGYKVFPHNRNDNGNIVSGLTITQTASNTFQNKVYITFGGTSLSFTDTKLPYLDAVITMDAEI